MGAGFVAVLISPVLFFLYQRLVAPPLAWDGDCALCSTAIRHLYSLLITRHEVYPH